MDGLAIVGLWPVVFGMVNAQQKLSVDLEVETNGRVFHGHGTAETGALADASAGREP